MKISVDGRVVDSRDTAIALIFDSAEEKESLLRHLSVPIRSALHLVPSDKDVGDVELSFPGTHFRTRVKHGYAT